MTRRPSPQPLARSPGLPAATADPDRGEDPPALPGRQVTVDPRQRRPDITKARELLGWEPKIDLETGLRLSLDYFKNAVAAESAVR